MKLSRTKASDRLHGTSEKMKNDAYVSEETDQSTVEERSNNTNEWLEANTRGEVASEWFVTHDKCGESDGPFKTYEEAEAHYKYLCSEGDPDSARWYFIEEIKIED